MLNEKDYCDYDTSIALGELGFPLKRMKVKNFIDGQFSDSIVTVLLYEAQKWLREEKHLIVDVRFGCPLYNVVISDHFHQLRIVMDSNNRIADFIEYEEALSEGIKEAVKILKKDETIHR